MKHHIDARTLRRYLVTILLYLVSASCGGGNRPPEPPPPVRTLLTWGESVNGTNVLDVDSESVEFYSDTRAMLYRGTEWPNLTVTAQNQLYWDGFQIGYVALVTSTQNQPLAALISMQDTILNVQLVGGSVQLTTTDFQPVFWGEEEREPLSWAGSTNGNSVLDADNEPVLFYADTRTLLYQGTEWPTVYVNTQNRLFWNSVPVGSVTLVASTAGTPIAALISNSGTVLDVEIVGNQIQLFETDFHPIFWLVAGTTVSFASESRDNHRPTHMSKIQNSTQLWEPWLGQSNLRTQYKQDLR